MENFFNDATFDSPTDLIVGHDIDVYIPMSVQEFSSKQHLEPLHLLNNSIFGNVQTLPFDFVDIETDNKITHNMTSDFEYNYGKVFNLQPTHQSSSVQDIIHTNTVIGQKVQRNFNTPIKDIENASAWFKDYIPYNESQYLKEKALQSKEISELAITSQQTNLNQIFYTNSLTNNAYSYEVQKRYGAMVNKIESNCNIFEENRKQHLLPSENHAGDNIATDSLGVIGTKDIITSHLISNEEWIDSTSLSEFFNYEDIQLLLDDCEKDPYRPVLADSELSLKQPVDIPEGTTLYEFMSCKSNEELAPTQDVAPSEAVKPPKRGRGRPRKVTSATVAETAPVMKSNFTHSTVERNIFQNADILQERKAKLKCQKIIEDIAFKDEPEFPQSELTTPYKKIKIQKIDKDDNFDPHEEASDAVPIEEKREMERIRNNIASKRSRDKRKEIENKQEMKWYQLKRNHEELEAMKERLKEALAIITRTRV